MPYGTKKILLSLCGITPAVITETVYALSAENPPLFPNEVVAVTTEEGRKAIRAELLDGGVWTDLRQTLNCEDKNLLRFGGNNYHLRVIPDPDGDTNARDIATSPTANSCADYLLNIVRAYSENPDYQIICSIAGGRKTMSVLCAQAMTLLGRKCDRLCHVLINPPFDDPALSPPFYFPPDPPQKYQHPEAGTVHSTQATITLTDIPFVRTRYLFSDILNRLPGTYLDTVAMANQRVSTARTTTVIELNPREQLLRINGSPISLSVPEYVFYYLLAERCRHKQPHLDGTKNALEAFQEFLQHLPVKTMPALYDKRPYRNKDEDDIRKLASGIRQKISKAFNSHTVPEAALPTVSRGVYGLQVPPEAIQIPDANNAGSDVT